MNNWWELSFFPVTAASRGLFGSHRTQKQTNTHLEGTFLSRFLAVTFQHFAIDSQAKNLSCDFIVVCHCVSLELQFRVGRWLEVREADAAPQAVGVTLVRRPVLRSNWIYRLLPLVMMHLFFSLFLCKNQQWCRADHISLCHRRYPVTS